LSRLYDDELRRAGVRTTQYSLLSRLSRVGKIRQRDLGRMASLDETTLTRNLQLLIEAGWVDTTVGEDEREKLVRITKNGRAKLRQARPAWGRAQARIRCRLPNGEFAALLAALPDLTRVADEA
jgi:DNA-binding MarR family transcriptional regulator